MKIAYDQGRIKYKSATKNELDERELAHL